jgi:hypothetical protein
MHKTELEHKMKIEKERAELIAQEKHAKYQAKERGAKYMRGWWDMIFGLASLVLVGFSFTILYTGRYAEEILDYRLHRFFIEGAERILSEASGYGIEPAFDTGTLMHLGYVAVIALPLTIAYLMFFSKRKKRLLGYLIPGAIILAWAIRCGLIINDNSYVTDFLLKQEPFRKEFGDIIRERFTMHFLTYLAAIILVLLRRRKLRVRVR